ncbi:MAG: class I SAM-dependent methyltransferase [Patescibacteria group bacterium]
MDSNTEAFLQTLKARNSAANVPSISRETGELLSGLVTEFGTASLLELGTAHGYSTVTLASAMWDAYEKNIPNVREDHPEPNLITVDFSKPSYEAAVANVEEAGFSPMVEHVFADALAYVPTLAGRRFDAVFLDAEKRSTAKLFDLAWPLVKEGGWMVVDDVVKFKNKMEDFYAFLARAGIPYEIVMTDPDDGVMVFRKG